MSNDFYRLVYEVAKAFELPVVVLTVLSFVVVVIELGAFVVELVQHSRRRFPRLREAATTARAQLRDGDPDGAGTTLTGAAWTPAMSRVLTAYVGDGLLDENAMAKHLADFDFAGQRRLSRTRLLVRTGPALGLMGTLIPLSPALEGLAKGDITSLTSNLQLAFSVTVLGLFIGVVAFAISLSRDRLYGQDYSDLEYVAAVLTSDSPVARETREPTR